MTNQVELDPSGGVLSINLIFGFLQFAKFEIILFDPHGENPKEIANGMNADDLPADFPIDEPAKNLIGRFLIWRAAIAPPAEGPDQQYLMKATFTQDGNPVQKATFIRSGPLNGVEVITDRAEFIQAKSCT